MIEPGPKPPELRAIEGEEKERAGGVELPLLRYCPGCRGEFREGIEVCPDCKLDLVSIPPPPSANEAGPEGLGGWLVLVGIGLFMGPIRMLATIQPLYANLTWKSLSEAMNPASEAYDPLWAQLVAAEAVGNFVVLLGSIALLVLFFSRSSRFPKWYVGLAVFSLMLVVADDVAARFVFADDPTYESEQGVEILRQLVVCAIWVPYMLVSKRVKATFVR